MRHYAQYFLSFFLGITSLQASADTGIATTTENSQTASNNMSNLTTYLKNLGEYFGYDLTQYCKTGGSCSSSSSSSYSNSLFNANATLATQLAVYNSYLGALLGGGTQASFNYIPLVPPNSENFGFLNTLSGQTYANPSYSSPSTQNVSVSPIIDQPTYQADPVSQGILNILATPNFTYCYDNNATKPIPNCTYLFRELVVSNVIGELPGTQTAFTSTYNQPIVPQLNSDTLLSPLLYSTTPVTDTANNNSSSKYPGLTATTQAQQAANFIRYAISSTNPIVLPTRTAYDTLMGQAQNYSGNTSPADQDKARAVLTTFLSKVRTYAAQSSVAMSNLYYMLSRRLPQTPAAGNGNPFSDALNEFTMATWRLYNPNAENNGLSAQWLSKINQGSAATVQKEMAILLAEINYQLYLTRQQQERLLLTQTMILMQTSQLRKPDGSTLSSSNEGTPAAETTGSQ